MYKKLTSMAIAVIMIILVQGMNIQGADAKMSSKNNKENRAEATFAGGCFWCTEADFEKLPGVIEAVSGYTGGHVEDPTYKEVCSGTTGHTEAVLVRFDPSKVSYAELLKYFWKHIDPVDAGGQFVDRGSQYRSAIFYHGDEQKHLAELSKEALEKSGVFDRAVATEITAASKFYSAEDYHQGYFQTCPVQYGAYRAGSGRDGFLEGAWTAESAAKFDAEFDRRLKEAGGSGYSADGESEHRGAGGSDYSKPDESSLKAALTPEQYRVTQQCGTEPPFQNEFWDNKREGIYVDVVSGEPLFSSNSKYASGSGWPSFYQPLEPENIVEKKDNTHGMTRVEVRSADGDSHLGHVFPDGPEPTGLRYCINSASLRFIPKEDMEKEGYGNYLKLFE